jgi:hypothetical protein
MEDRSQHFAMKLFSITLLTVLIAFGIWERHSIATLRTENAALSEHQSTAQALADDNAALAKRLGEASAPAPDVKKSELLRLRNDVRRLRSSQTDPTRLRAENEKIAADLKSGKIRPQRLADQPGFVGRESWANLGAGTPEDALQTFFSAMRDANIELLVGIVGVREGSAMRQAYQKDPTKMQEEFKREAQKNFPATGYVIAGREDLGGDKIRLKVRFAAQSDPLDFEFQRDGSGWRMSKAF